VTTTPLLADLRQAADKPVPKDFRPSVTYAGRQPDQITTDALPTMETEAEWEAAVAAMGIHLPEGFGLVLVEAVLAGSTNEAAWHRDPGDRRENHTAYTAPNTTQRWRYRFKVVLKDPRADVDIAVLAREAKRRKRPKPPTRRRIGTMIIDLADFQVGKVDNRGGTADLLERSEAALSWKLLEAERLRPAQIVLVDGGDSTEGFESAPNAQRTNDLQQTEQIRVWRRIFWRWIDALSRVTEDLVVLGVPSNHCHVRQGKNRVGSTLDDWGIEVLAQVADIAKGNPEAYGHVRFFQPEDTEEHVLFTMADGLVLGVIHGDQVSRPDMLPEFLKRNQKRGRGIGSADIVLVHHFHHLRLQAFGDGQTMIIAPTNDNGSTWFQYSGEDSQPGVLSLQVDDVGPHGIDVTWTS